uniref:Uncharacterized protein n=1 Tax=Oryza punctata TaxID=4537 RepID=A0A0E0KPD5_ORYPU
MARGSKAVVIVLLSVVALLSLAVAGPAAGDMRAVMAGGKVGRHDHDVHAAIWQVMMTTKSTRLEDVVAPELGMDDLGELHKRILGRDDSNSNGLEPNRPACPRPPSPCPARGQQYIDRGCKGAYGSVRALGVGDGLKNTVQARKLQTVSHGTSLAIGLCQERRK